MHNSFLIFSPTAFILPLMNANASAGKKGKNRGEFHPTVFKLLATEDKLTAAAGLATLMEIFNQSPLSQGFREALPARSTINGRSGGSYRLGLIQLNSLIYGHDCLDDLEEFRGEPCVEASMKGESVAARTMGDFLRDFGPEHREKMNGYLSPMARSIRKQLIANLPAEFRPNSALTIDMDSTDHEQHGKKMEGLARNYKGTWGLYSEVAYDELGLCHGIELAPGNTKPGSTCIPLLQHCFSGLKFADTKFFRADSAYCYQDVIRTCISLGVSYTIAAHDGTTEWRSHIPEVTDWLPWAYSEEDFKKAAKTQRSLPKIELGRFHWQPSWADNLRIPVIVKRTWKEEENKSEEKDGQLILLTVPAHWEYYAIITNWNLFHHSLQEVMAFYLKRGNAENFIREEKYGFDLKHFPCIELGANHAYAQLAMVAHNILRWVAITEKPEKPHFSKKIRHRYIYIPGKIVFHARQVFLKIPAHFLEEVERLKRGLRFNPDQPAFASGFS
jgi:Transposase DDE domain group 1